MVIPLQPPSLAGAPTPHQLGGVHHGPDTLANLNLKVSDADLASVAALLAHIANAAAHHAKTGDNEVYGLVQAGLAAGIPAPGIVGRWYFATDTLILSRDNGAGWVEIARGETVTRLAQLAEKVHGSLTGIGASDHHVKYTDAEAAAVAAVLVAIHEVLTTGVHGVGAGTVAKVGDIAVDGNLSAAGQDAIAKKHTQGTDTALGAVGTKATPVNADKLLQRNSAAGDALVTSTWTQIKAFFKTYFDTLYRSVTANHTHQSAGAQAGKLDHGLALNGLADDDHPQYIKHSLATAVSDFLVASGAGVFVKKTLAEVKTILGLGTAAYTTATDYVTHALATAANDFIVASGSGTFVKKTLAEVRTLLNWAADIAAHAALTTGVHGVGARHVAETSVEDLDLAAHKSRHEWLGDDEISIAHLAIQLALSLTTWMSRDGWTDYLVGSGSINHVGPFNMRPTTGATINSIAALYTGNCTSLSPGTAATPSVYTVANPRAATPDSEVWIVCRHNTVAPASFPSITERHWGWRIVDNRVWASNGDGVNGTQTDTGINLPCRLTILAKSASIEFYINSALVATHTTNLPPTYNYYIWIGIKNLVAASRIVQIYSVGFAL